MPRRTLRVRSEEHTSELQSPFLISYAVFCLKKKTNASSMLARVRRSIWLDSKKTPQTSAKSHRCVFFFKATPPTEIYTRKDTLSLHDALPISESRQTLQFQLRLLRGGPPRAVHLAISAVDRKSTRLNSSHPSLSRMPSSA